MHEAFLSAALHLELPLASDTPPSAFRIFRAGVNKTVEGEFLFDAEAAAAVMQAAQEYGNDLSLDYGHGMFAGLAVDPAEAGKAAGWFSLEVRDGELWATKVRWTKRAAAYLSEKEYRFISPAFRHDAKHKRISRLLNVALTNIPKMTSLAPLVAASQAHATPEARTMDLKALIALLSLKSDSSEQDVLTALAALSAQVSQTRELLALCSAGTVSEALGKVRAWQEAAGRTAAVEAKLAQAEAASRKLEIDTLLDKAVADKKVMPAEREFLASMAANDLDKFKGYLSARVAAPGVLPGVVNPPKGGETSTVTLSQSDLDVARMLGVSPDEYAKHKAKAGPMRTGILGS